MTTLNPILLAHEKNGISIFRGPRNAPIRHPLRTAPKKNIRPASGLG